MEYIFKTLYIPVILQHTVDKVILPLKEAVTSKEPRGILDWGLFTF
jgi:hypothetical protein